MNTSCIPHPPGETLVLIRAWQVEACGGNLCAAALLNFFEYWHNVKLSNREQAKNMNDVAEKHGEARTQDESLLQWHSTEDLQQGLLTLYGESLIQRAVKVLEKIGFISIQKNPNPAYKWDKTNHYLFHPENVIAWLRMNRGLDTDYSPDTPVKSDAVKIRHRERKNTDSTTQKYGIDGGKNTAAIPEITSETTPEKKDPPVDANASTSPKGDETRGTRLPKDWQPSEADYAWAKRKGYHTVVDLADVTEEFGKYWRNVPGKDGRKIDWSETWQNRVMDLGKREIARREARASPSRVSSGPTHAGLQQWLAEEQRKDAAGREING